MKERLKEICTHCRINAGVAGAYAAMALQSGKPEIYLPIAGIYALKAWLET